MRDVLHPVVGAPSRPYPGVGVQAGGGVGAGAGAAHQGDVGDVQAPGGAGADHRAVGVAEQGETGGRAGDPVQVVHQVAQRGCGAVGACGRGDGGADGARCLVAQPGHHGGAGPRGSPGDELPVQGEGGGAEPAVGVEAGVGTRHQHGDAVGPGEVAEDLGGQSGAPAVEREEVAGRVRQGTVRRRAVPVAVVGGHPGRPGRVGPVGGVDLLQRGGRRGRRRGGGRGGDLGPRGGGEREHHGTGDQGGATGAAPSAHPQPPTYLRPRPHGLSPPPRPSIGRV
ncbi:hypothetical protein STENM223S_08837 [Streptomyces tendae]